MMARPEPPPSSDEPSAEQQRQSSESRRSISPASPIEVATPWSDEERSRRVKWRHTLGIALLLVTVVLWTSSNFLASTIFADNTYSKPYFVTYVNSAFFIIPLIPILVTRERREPGQLTGIYNGLRNGIGMSGYTPVRTVEDDGEEDPFLKPDDTDGQPRHSRSPSGTLFVENGESRSPVRSALTESSTSEKLNMAATARISLQFSLIWFLANYFTAACLEYTTVASSTILTSTSSIWTLVCGSIFGVEKFTLKKLFGVLASLAGIVLISTVDISGESDENRGTFPHKTPKEIAIGDALAFLSALLYGIYAVIMKKRIGDESKVNMPLFFGLVGLFNTIFLWPFFLILHLTGVETFELPPGGRVLIIILVNSTTSLVSDMCWAYAMLLTSPLIVTVGLSLTIPLSLIGQMVLNSQSSSVGYWIGACVVLLSFIFINHEENKDEATEEVPLTDTTSAVS